MMQKNNTPVYLQKGDKVAVVAPAGKIDAEKIKNALNTITSWGFNVVQGSNFLNVHGYFAGTDAERLSDLQNAINDPSIKAIFCMRGGYGLTRIIDKLDLNHIKRYPKWIIGFSDITVLHLKLASINFESVHGIMPALFNPEKTVVSVDHLHDFLFGKVNEISWDYNIRNISGRAHGKLIGGNLSILADSIGTKTAPDGSEAILFLEEVDEYLYKIDRMLVHLARAGILEKIKALLIGHFTAVKDTKTPFGQPLEDIILDKVAHLKIPVAFGLPSGHDEPNLALPHNRMVHLEVTETKSLLSF